MQLENDDEEDKTSMEFAIIGICNYMHWSYKDYRDAPKWMIDNIVIKMLAENTYSKFQRKKLNKNN